MPPVERAATSQLAHPAIVRESMRIGMLDQRDDVARCSTEAEVAKLMKRCSRRRANEASSRARGAQLREPDRRVSTGDDQLDAVSRTLWGGEREVACEPLASRGRRNDYREGRRWRLHTAAESKAETTAQGTRRPPISGGATRSPTGSSAECVNPPCYARASSTLLGCNMSLSARARTARRPLPAVAGRQHSAVDQRVAQ